MFKRDVNSAILKLAVATVAFEDLGKYLPFQTRIISGETFNHIQSLHAYDVKTYGKVIGYASGRYTPEYTVSEGDTLCRRSGRSWRWRMDENCPGCLAIAQGIIKRDIENA